MKLFLVFFLAAAVYESSAQGGDPEPIDRYYFPGMPWQPPSSWMSVSSPEINSREHGVRPGRVGTTCGCGVANRRAGSRIVGGRVYEKNEYPFIAGLVNLTPYRPFCGGTIISRNHVVTAAHCTADVIGKAPLHVVVGDYDRTGGPKPGDVIIPVQSIAQHPQYDARALSNDISVLILAQPIQFNERVSPICMPKGPMNIVGQYIRIIGWGASRFQGPMTLKPQKVDLRVVDQQSCAASWQGQVQINTHQICTHSKRKTACQGDSGGPVIYLDPDTNRYTLVGAVSFGAKCEDNQPSVQTDVTKYLPWINGVIRGNSPSATCTKL